ncbi:hypothetical protein ACSTJG_24245, partial [Vibrio parahaemolyticus]
AGQRGTQLVALGDRGVCCLLVRLLGLLCGCGLGLDRRKLVAQRLGTLSGGGSGRRGLVGTGGGLVALSAKPIDIGVCTVKLGFEIG